VASRSLPTLIQKCAPIHEVREGAPADRGAGQIGHAGRFEHQHCTAPVGPTKEARGIGTGIGKATHN